MIYYLICIRGFHRRQTFFREFDVLGLSNIPKPLEFILGNLLLLLLSLFSEHVLHWINVLRHF